ACCGPGGRLLRSGEIGVSIHVHEPHPAVRGPEAEQRAEDDTAVAADHQGFPATGGCRRDPLRESTTVFYQTRLVAHLTRSAHPVLIGSGSEIAQVNRAQGRRETQLPQGGGRATEGSLLPTLIVRTNTDRRGGTHQRQVALRRSRTRAGWIHLAPSLCNWLR